MTTMTNENFASHTWLRQKAAITREVIWRDWTGIHNRIERTSESRMKAVLFALLALSFKRIDDDDQLPRYAELVLPQREFVNDVTTSLVILWLLSADHGYRFESSWIRAAAPKRNPQPLNLTTMPARMQRDVSKWISSQGNQQAIWQHRSIAKKFNAALVEARADGRSKKPTMRKLKRTMRRHARIQAAEVARTQTSRGMNLAQQLTRTTFEVPKKEWVSTKDDHTRPGVKKGGGNVKSKYNHRKPDGQIVSNENPFSVSGELLLFPTDTSLGATLGNIIRCRCASVAYFPTV